LVDDETAGQIEREAGEEIEAAVSFARQSPFPDPQIASTLVYAT